jgi:histidine triad (HIT) family protein
VTEAEQPSQDQGLEEDCLFCKILAGAVPSEEVCSTSKSYAFRDINPVASTHVLVIPREHVRDAHHIRASHAEALADMFLCAQEVARLEGLEERGYRLVMNVGPDALNSVGHLHLHVIGGRQMGWPPL